MTGRDLQHEAFMARMNKALSFEWQTTKQIADQFGYYTSGSIAAVVKRLNIMREVGEIERLQEPGCETSWRKV